MAKEGRAPFAFQEETWQHILDGRSGLVNAPTGCGKTFSVFLGALIDDEETSVAALFVEQIRRPQTFLALAKRARKLGKPIVVMHPGRSQRARISASSHTGALTGDHAVMEALLRHAAVVVVETLEELVDTAEFLARFKPPVNGPGIITNSGAIKGFSIDFCDRIGLDIPVLGATANTALKAALPPFASPDNPVDVTAQVLRDRTLWTHTARAVLADPGVGSLCIPMVAGSLKYAMDKVEALLPTILAAGKPTVIAVLGDEFPVPPEFIAAQIDAVFSDLAVGAVKIGMLSQPAVIEAVAAGLDRWKQTHVVLDPVMVATSGDRLINPQAIDTLKRVLIPRAALITPNLPEAAALLDCAIARDEEEMRAQACRLIEAGARAVLIKGGHGDGAESVDVRVGPTTFTRLATARIATKNTHGTGCTLSAAIAAGLAKGLDLVSAVREAKVYVSEAIAASERLRVGGGHGPVHHFHRWW